MKKKKITYLDRAQGLRALERKDFRDKTLKKTSKLWMIQTKILFKEA